ncbi:MAG: flagellar basal-body rod protein FlgF [Proteobacteria bacterium]|nr:flagellar basal-body rod protein FlgF [Pseudomonadota bacterium]MBU4471524.1 flagellar basal-body rod protein FlgF [Pseudomonadota bacterium]MCG2752530.1 flagellar basal-body rod protein FlgF [Desulfobacteraceae bacterium]
MSDSIGDVVAGAMFQQLRLGTISNNLANANTIGFKKDGVIFDAMGSVPLPDAQGSATSSMESDIFAANIPARTFTDFEQGHLVATGNKLDFAIDGKGFFCVQTKDGDRYTRKGNFALNENKELCTVEGLPILGEGGKITIDKNDFQIDESGTIFVGGSRVDSLKVVDFEPNSLIKKGDNLFEPINSDIQEKEAQAFTIQQGNVEQSNVNAVKMMTEMIDTLRGYESYQKVITSLNESTMLAINKIGEIP